MNIQFYFEKLKASDEFKSFLKENPDSFFCGGFFITGKKNISENQQNLDFFIPSKKQIISFNLKDFERKKIDFFSEQESPGEISEEIEIDFTEIEEILEERMDKEEIKNKAEKFLFSLQKVHNDIFLTGTIFLDKFALIKFLIDLNKKEIIEFEKKSFFDLIKFVKKDK